MYSGNLENHQHLAFLCCHLAHAEAWFLIFVTGHGVFTKRYFVRGEFLIEYAGDLIQPAEADDICSNTAFIIQLISKAEKHSVE